MDPNGKVFFSHIHKAAGTSFLEFLRQSELVHLDNRYCNHLMDADSVHTTSTTRLYDWWVTSEPLRPPHNCTLLMLEMPMLGLLLRLMENRGMYTAEVFRREPQAKALAVTVSL